jgi:predicted ATPase/DNA-binding winged helix-turn-helix (wHTH) protein
MGVDAHGDGVCRFGACEFDVARRRLLVCGSPSRLGSRALEVLALLIANPGRAITRNELLDAVWQGRVVEENNIAVQVTNLRKVLGPDTIATLPGIGYRFSAALEGRPIGRPAPLADPTELSPRARAGNVAPFQPELIGREDARTNIIATLAEHRLVTIWGPGGMGKTMLARTVASDLRENFTDGVWMIELAPLSELGVREEPDEPIQDGADDAERRARDAQVLLAVVGLVAETLEIKVTDTDTPAEQLAKALSARRMLLVLDNCEHLTRAVALLARTLLEHNEAMRLLATSQALLESPEESPYELKRLSVPQAGDPAAGRHGAVHLLVKRVQALHPRFRLTDKNTGDAIEVCDRLDGMPLAIELAAARVPVLGLAGVRERLEQQRFNLLSSVTQKAPRRQQTLEKTLAWSHSLLGAGARAALRRAGVFAGSFGLDQAQQVLAAEDEDPWRAIDHLATLVNRSLVTLERVEPPRYRLLESARAYALQRLEAVGETETTLERHARATCALFESSLDDEWSMPSQDRIERYMPDLDNGRAALAWARVRDPALYVRLAAALGWLFDTAIQNLEGLKHCLAARELAHPHVASARVRARLHLAIAILGRVSLRSEAMAAAWRAVRLLRDAGDDALLYVAWGRFAIAASLCVRGARGLVAVRHMRRLATGASWPTRSHWDLLNADDFVSNCIGDKPRARSLASQAYRWAIEHHDVHKTMFAIMAQEQCATTDAGDARKAAGAAVGNYGEAIRLGRLLVDMAGEHRHVKSRHVYMYNLANALAMSGNLREALPLARQSILVERSLQTLDQELELMAKLALLQDRPDGAALIIGRSEFDNGWRADQREPVERNTYEDVIAGLRDSPRWPALDDLRVRGSRLRLEAAVDLALCEATDYPTTLETVLAELDHLQRIETARADIAVDEWNHAVALETGSAST